MKKYCETEELSNYRFESITSYLDINPDRNVFNNSSINFLHVFGDKRSSYTIITAVSLCILGAFPSVDIHKYPTNELHKETNCLKLNDLYEFKILKFMHHVHHNKGQLPVVFQNYFSTNDALHRYDTLQSKHYQIHKAKKKWGNRMIRNKGARLWNALPLSLRSIHKQKIFANKLKKYITDKYLRLSAW